MTVQQYCLRWNNHQPNFISVFSSLLSSQSLVDVTLAAEGKHLQAHKVVLSACSSYFQSLFTVNPCKHPIVILKDVKFADLKVMVDFMYHGEVNVSQEQLPYILKTAEMLKIKGLTEIPVDQSITSRCQSRIADKQNLSFQPEDSWNVDDNRPTSPSSPTSKRKRLKKNVICSTGTAIDVPEGGSGDILLSSMDNVFGTVMKSENERYISTENTNTTSTTTQKCNGAPVPSIQTGAAHDVIESEPSPHHISLQVTPHEINTSHSLECSTIDMPRTTTTTAPQMTTGIQWNVLGPSGYAHFSSATSSIASNSAGTQFSHSNNDNNIITTTTPASTTTNTPPINNPTIGLTCATSDPTSDSSYHHHHHLLHQTHKRKRHIHPQADQNFMRALEAVRFGGIGFCKAARMYGVNNRTLWLEYKKRGYPNFRLSIKNRHLRQLQSKQESAAELPNPQQATTNNVQMQPPKTIACTLTHPIALINSSVFEGKHMELKHVLARDKYFDVTDNPAETINFSALNLEQI